MSARKPPTSTAFNFINNGNLYAINFLLAVAGDLILGDYFASGNLSLTAGGSLTIGNVVALGDLALTAGTDLTAGNLDADGDVALTAGNDILAGYINAGGGIAAEAGGNLTLGALASGIVPPPPQLAGDFSTSAAVVNGLDVILVSEGNLSVESIDSAGAISLTAGGTLNSGNLTAATAITGNSVGNLDVGAVQAHDNIAFASSGGNVTTGAVTSLAGGIALDANGTLVTGALNAGTDIDANSAGNLTVVDVQAGGNVSARFVGRQCQCRADHGWRWNRPGCRRHFGNRRTRRWNRHHRQFGRQHADRKREREQHRPSIPRAISRPAI